jgi:hypothetical protein
VKYSKIYMAKDAGALVGGATAAATGTETKTAATPKPEVKVHLKLLELIRKADAAAEKAGTLLVEVGELVMKENISNPALIKTIMEARGCTESNAKSQASRIRSLLKDTDQFEALKRGEVTVRAAVKSAQARRTPTPVSKQKAFDKALNAFTTAAKALGQNKRTILATVEAALDKAQVK